jgi:hypothetical protein
MDSIDGDWDIENRQHANPTVIELAAGHTNSAKMLKTLTFRFLQMEMIFRPNV